MTATKPQISSVIQKKPIEKWVQKKISIIVLTWSTTVLAKKIEIFISVMDDASLVKFCEIFNIIRLGVPQRSDQE